MKKIFLFLAICLTFLFTGCFFDSAITEISLDIESQTLLIGESIEFNISKTPSDSKENILVSCTVPDIVSVTDNTITATNAGETEICFKAKKKSITKKIKIRVLESEPNLLMLENSAYAKLQRATIDIRCKHYNKNFWGKETDEILITGFGIIIETRGCNAFFITDKNLLLHASGRDYTDRYIIDYGGDKYDIVSYLSYENSDIAIGYFVPEFIENYNPTSINQTPIFKGDYALRADLQRFSRISNIDENYFYLPSAIDRHNGVPLLNLNGDLIGMAKTHDGTTTTVINQTEIKRIVDRYFEGK